LRTTHLSARTCSSIEKKGRTPNVAKRRGKGEGSIYQRKDGRWEGAVTVGITASGNPKRVRRYGATRAEVAKKLADLLAAYGQGMLAEPNQLTVGDWLRQWLAESSLHLEDSTIDSYERLITKHIAPAIGGVKLTALRPVHLKTLYLDLSRRGYALRTRQYVHSLIASGLKAAVRLELIPRNVADVVRPEGKDDRKDIEVWTPQEAAHFLDVGQIDRLYPAFYLMLCLGLRRGEVLGLRWVDIDFGAGTLSV
jgi:integrase